MSDDAHEMDDLCCDSTESDCIRQGFCSCRGTCGCVNNEHKCSDLNDEQLRELSPAVAEGVVEHAERHVGLKYNKPIDKESAFDEVYKMIGQGVTCAKALDIVSKRKTPFIHTIGQKERYAVEFIFEEGNDLASLAKLCRGKKGHLGHAMVCIAKYPDGDVEIVGVALMTISSEGEPDEVICCGTRGLPYIRVNKSNYRHHVAVKDVTITKANAIIDSDWSDCDVPELSPFAPIKGDLLSTQK